MAGIPEFWRTEVFHPLSVHFPVALLLAAFVFKLISLISKNYVWVKGGSVLLIAGTVAAWLSVYTGNLADGAVSRTICDPTVLKDHENAAYTVAWLFSAATVLDLLNISNRLSFNKTIQNIAVILLLAVGSAYLVYTGHSGATLVYQQGAGVYKPSPDCAEFN
ncbi:MAG: hypothetical protein LPK19_15400 [Hymenobacteraceae bacterium]|nr:hypothetical protein [Hymenobacteraceae bacterium]MDX5397619.1 hypothetical protein [Hymenobacteraceae bacterium]MDX5513699.1 hypothetical protein [Hymenobacteraceae bacterium]